MLIIVPYSSYTNHSGMCSVSIETFYNIIYKGTNMDSSHKLDWTFFLCNAQLDMWFSPHFTQNCISWSIMMQLIMFSLLLFFTC